MTGAAGMNDLGHIVGDAYVKGRWVWHAILYRPDGGTIKDLKTLGGEDSFAQDINDFGDIVGTSDVQANKITSAFLMTNGRMWDLVELIDTDSSGNVPAGLLKGLTINNARFICGPKYGHDALPAFLLVPYVPE
jgi:probable HAF family extracellular repeat protein